MPTRKIILLTMAVVAMQAVAAQRLYVFKTDGAQDSMSTQSVRRISFSGEAMTVLRTSGEATGYAYATLRCLSLVPPAGAVPTGVAQLPDEAVSAFPNPCTAALTLVCPTDELRAAEIFNLHGLRCATHALPGGGKASLDMAHLPVGLYFVKIATAKGFVIKAIIKN